MRSGSGYCSNPKCGTWRHSLHRDHIVPKFRGGSDEPSNIQLLCANCHEDKTRADMTNPPADLVARRAAGRRGKLHSEEAKAKMRAWHTGKVLSAEHKAKIAAAMVGRVYSEETIEKMRAAQSGKVFSESARASMSRAAKARSQSDEFKQRVVLVLTAANKGKALSPKHRAKISAALSGRPKVRRA